MEKGLESLCSQLGSKRKAEEAGLGRGRSWAVVQARQSLRQPLGARECVLPIEVVLCWAEMAEPFYPCLTQTLAVGSPGEDRTLAGSSL